MIGLTAREQYQVVRTEGQRGDWLAENPVEFDLKRLPPKALIVQLQWQQSLATADDIKDIMQAVYRKVRHPLPQLMHLQCHC